MTTPFAAARFAAIILAAGLSSRMGSPKPLLPLGEGTIADRIVGAFLQNQVDVYVVVGHRKDEVLPALKNLNINVVENPEYQRGMFSSIQAGVSNLRADHKWFFVIPVDIPLVRPQTIARLMSEATKNPESVVYPSFRGRRGHPVLIPARLTHPILRWEGEGGLKALLSEDGQAIDVAVADSNILFDVDSPADYQELTERERLVSVPSESECDAILDMCDVAQDIRQHCSAVAAIALRLALTLLQTGAEVDIGLVQAASTLHDIAKGHPDHDAEGARILHGFGFGRVAGIIAVHTDLSGDRADLSIESRIVFLADKLITGTRLVSIEERYESALKKYGQSAAVREAISLRKAVALSVKQELELRLGCSIESLLRAT